MQLVKAGRVVDDRFVRVLDGAPLPDGPVLLPGERFLSDHAALAARRAAVGVIWPNNRKVSALAPHLHRLDLIALVFPSFRDGRAYSQARQLREQLAYRGELRATGEVLRDQYLFLIRAGFDSFEVKKDADVAAFLDALPRYSVFYQPAADARLPAWRRRLVDGPALHNPAAQCAARKTAPALARVGC
jgi:uncharacterized protein (DUF934 family)